MTPYVIPKQYTVGKKHEWVLTKNTHKVFTMCRWTLPNNIQWQHSYNSLQRQLPELSQRTYQFYSQIHHKSTPANEVTVSYDMCNACCTTFYATMPTLYGLYARECPLGHALWNLRAHVLGFVALVQVPLNSILHFPRAFLYPKCTIQNYSTSLEHKKKKAQPCYSPQYGPSSCHKYTHTIINKKTT